MDGRTLASAWLGLALIVSLAPAGSGDAQGAKRRAGTPVPVDHGTWQLLLGKYVVDGPGPARFRYGAVTRADRDSLEAYLIRMRRIRPSRLPNAEQKGFWLNLYNSMTVALVLQHYPVESIRDISLFQKKMVQAGQGPWDAIVLLSEGRPLSLNDIEHRILRKQWRDPLVHFGLNCASLGCPDLPAVAFTGENADSLLESGAVRFVNSPRGAAFSGDTLVLSSLFEWYREDFGKDRKQLIAFLARFATPDLRARLIKHSGPVRYRYDWRLNDAAGPGSAPASGKRKEPRMGNQSR